MFISGNTGNLKNVRTAHNQTSLIDLTFTF